MKSNQQILTKAIEKAIANGWDQRGMDEVSVDASGHLLFIKKGQKYYDLCAWHTIYQHDFAKALWGEDKMLHDYGRIPAWQVYLMEMVIADDPLAYLGDNI